MTGAYSSLYEIWRAHLPNRNPVLPYFLLHGMLEIGRSEWWLRLPSLIGGLLTIYAGFLVGREAGGKSLGLVMAFLLTFSPIHARLSQVLRYYSPMVAFLMLGFYFYLRWHNRRQTSDAVLFSVFSCLAVSCHYMAVVFVFSAGIHSLAWALRKGEKKQAAVDLACAYAPLAITLGFFFLTHIIFLQTASSRVGFVSPWLRALYPETLFEGGLNTLNVFGFLFGQHLFGMEAKSTYQSGAIYLAIFLFGLIVLWKQNQWSLVALCLIPFPLGVLFGKLHLFPFGASRHSVYLTPLIFIPAAIAIQQVLASKRRLVIIPGVLLLFGYATFHTTFRERYLAFPTVATIEQARQCARDFWRKTEPGDTFLTTRGTICTLAFYLDIHEGNFVDEESNIEGGSKASLIRDRHLLRRPGWSWDTEDFLSFVRSMGQMPEYQELDSVWVLDAGWGPNLKEIFAPNSSGYELLELNSYGNKISLMRIRLPRGDSEPQMNTDSPG